jgi:hypothetical protein
VQFAIADLTGADLGLANAQQVSIDRDAAGHGWFVDPTPAKDEGFATAAPSGAQRAIDPRAVDHIDLLSVVEHELGHTVGLEDLDPWANDLMSGTLATGLRRSATKADVDALFAADASHAWAF